MVKFYFFIISVFFASTCKPDEYRLKILFRFDDFTLVNNTFQDSLIKIFTNNEIPLNLGIIPYDQSSEPRPLFSFSPEQIELFSELVRQGKIDPALHGYNHKLNSISEFNKLSFADQYDRIQKGKIFLDSLLKVKVCTFIPPWNSYDRNTVSALTKLGFTIISSDLFGQATNDSIGYLPCTYDRIQDLKRIIQLNQNRNGILVVMFHQYDFSGYTKTGTDPFCSLEELNQLLYWIRQTKLGTFTFSELIKVGEDLSIERFKVNSSLRNGIFGNKFRFIYFPGSFHWYKFLEIFIWTGLYLILVPLILLAVSFRDLTSNIRILRILLIIDLVFIAFLISRSRFTPGYLLLIHSSVAFAVALGIYFIIRIKKSFIKM